MELTLRSTHVLKQEAEDIGLHGKDIAEYVRRQETLDREERAAWREAQKMQAQADVELAKIRAEAERVEAEENRRAKDAKSPKRPSFIDEKDELDSYLLRFELYAENASWEKDTWAIKLSALLTGRAMDVYTRMLDDQTPVITTS